MTATVHKQGWGQDGRNHKPGEEGVYIYTFFVYIHIYTNGNKRTSFSLYTRARGKSDSILLEGLSVWYSTMTLTAPRTIPMGWHVHLYQRRSSASGEL